MSSPFFLSVVPHPIILFQGTELWLVPGDPLVASHLCGFALALTSWNELLAGLPGKVVPIRWMTYIPTLRPFPCLPPTFPPSISYPTDTLPT